MELRRQLLLGAVLGLVSWQASACYTVYDASSRVLYRSSLPPVDMSQPISDALPLRYPGGHLVFDMGAACEPMAVEARASAGRTSLLFTDRSTAQAMGVPYTVVRGEIVMVRPAVASPVPAPLAPAAISRKIETVITELRNPPLQIVERGDKVMISNVSR